MAIEWNKVTWYSKLFAVILFFAVFIFAFKLGILYKEVEILNQDVKKLDVKVDNINEDFSLKIGEAKVINNFSVTLTDIKSDSRCPQDVQCIWEGTVEATLNFNINNENIIKEIYLGKETRFLGYVFTIKSVDPQKNSDKSIEKKDYSITFHVSK